MTPADAEAVRRLLGREPMVDAEVAWRCPLGGPAVLACASTDRRGRPFPTRNWLACRELGAAVSRLESEGGIRELEDDPGMQAALVLAHRRHARLHAGHRVAGAGGAARVKCLHAQLAFSLGEGGGPIADRILERTRPRRPATCCAEPS
jgi:hypothetical protein